MSDGKGGSMEESQIKNPSTLSLMKATCAPPEMFISEAEAEKSRGPDIFEVNLSLQLG